MGDLSQGELISFASSLFGTTDNLTGGKYVQVFNGNFQYFTGGLENVPDGWTISNDLWDGTTATTNMHLSSTSQSGRFSIVMDHTNGILRSRLIPIDLVDFTPFAFELVWRRANSPGTVPRVTFRWFDEDRAAIEPYGSGHSNRGLHPVETDPQKKKKKNARRVVDVNGTGGGGTEMILSVAVAETAQYAVDDIIDYVPGYLTPSQDFMRRRCVVTTVGGGGTPTYTVEFPTESTVPTTGGHTDRGVMGWRPPYWQADDSVSVHPSGTWFTSRQQGIEPPSLDAKFVQIEIEAFRQSGAAQFDILIDSISLYRIGREMRIAGMLRNDQTTYNGPGQWSHTRHKFAHPGPLPAAPSGPPFYNGFDYGNNLRTDGFPAASNNEGPHFLAQEDGILYVASSFAVIANTASATVRGRLRIVKNATYSDFAGGFLSSIAAGASGVCCHSPVFDNLNQQGLAAADTLVCTISDRVRVCRGDRVTVEAYVTASSGTLDIVQDENLNFTHVELEVAD